MTHTLIVIGPDNMNPPIGEENNRMIVRVCFIIGMVRAEAVPHHLHVNVDKKFRQNRTNS